MKDINITVKNDSPFYFGMKVYTVMANPKNKYKTFYDKCPVCEGTREIEFKGFKLTCPMCNGGRGNIQNAQMIRLNNYTVVQFIINKVMIEGSNIKSDYKITNSVLPKASFCAFARWGTSISDIAIRNIDTYRFRDVEAEKVNLDSLEPDCWFYSKADAQRFCKELHERNKAALDKFNADHGTNYEYPFDN